MSMPKVSLIFPCLNEAATIGECVQEAQRVFKENNIDGEVIVVDCFSTDGSADIARKLGARVIQDKRRGYGLAYLLGVEAAKGEWLLKADSDGTYDMDNIPAFVEKLRAGCEYVIGNRFKGGIEPGAMPFMHHYIGNPILTWMQNVMFGLKVGDAPCGFRAFTKDAFCRMELKSRGMEFAAEMSIKAARLGLKVCEIPVRYHPRKTPSKLQPFRDGWRNVRFMLLFSPDHLFILPGILFLLAGAFASLVGLDVFNDRVLAMAPPDANLRLLLTMLGSFLILSGFQVISFGVSAKSYAVVSGYEKKDALYSFVNRYFKLETALLLGFALIALVIVYGLQMLLYWLANGIHSVSELKNAVALATLAILGGQMIFNALFLSALGIERA